MVSTRARNRIRIVEYLDTISIFFTFKQYIRSKNIFKLFLIFIYFLATACAVNFRTMCTNGAIADATANPLRLTQVAGFEDRKNDVVYSKPLVASEEARVVVFFPGDVQVIF